MLLFSRSITPSASPRHVMPFVEEVTAYVNANSGLDVACWSALFGRPIGSVAWTSVVESQAELVAATANLMADDGYLDLLERGTEVSDTPGEDQLLRSVYGERRESSIGSVVNMTTGLALPERMSSAMEWAVDMAQFVESVIGSPVTVGSSLYGPIGGFALLTVSDDIAEAEANRAKIQSDPTYAQKVSESAGLFLPGSGHATQAMRII